MQRFAKYPTFPPPVLHLSLIFTFTMTSIHVLTHNITPHFILSLLLLYSIDFKAFSTLFLFRISFLPWLLFHFQTSSPFFSILKLQIIYNQKEAQGKPGTEFSSFSSPMFSVILGNTMSKNQTGKFLLCVKEKAKPDSLCTHNKIQQSQPHI